MNRFINALPNGHDNSGLDLEPAGDCTFLFTSESVGEGHPDKLCDQISDAILDAHLKGDPEPDVVCNAIARPGIVLICGEISSKANVDYQQVIRDTIEGIGYDDLQKGFDYDTCTVILALDQQCSNDDIDQNRPMDDVGDGDQVRIFGYATNETEECVPLTVVLAHNLNKKIAELRKSKEFWWARPDSKAQVTCEYNLVNGACVPQRVHTVIISVQHCEKITLEDIRREVMDKVVNVVIPKHYLDDNSIFHINPRGKFILGGPQCKPGKTGRKITVDTYGGWGAYGSVGFSGKDYTKVDRSAAYAARWVAKSLVKSDLCKRCLVQVSYAIDVPEPLSITVFDYGTSNKTQDELLQIVKNNFDLRPSKIAEDLDLQKPIYQKTSTYGHFGHDIFTWEKPKDLIIE